jgi:hypothetical protein
VTTYFASAYIAAQIKRLGGRPVTIGAQTTQGLIDISDEELLLGEAVSGVGQRIEVKVATGSLTGLVVGASVNVDGIVGTVKNIRQGEDGDSGMTLFRIAT